ncbi:VanZ family protein [Rhodoferax sp.]|uniref:VanZ family protein n=1 Tax=Rhodoferax sp. TaxID=50421 RepID=UPI0025CCD529|nr:VanZ family protein [Rhodoferax sp.]
MTNPNPNNLRQRLGYAMTAIIAPTRAWQVILSLLIVAVIYLALAPAPPSTMDTGWDKLNHALAFTALAFAGYLGFPAALAGRTLLLAALFGLGGAIEILQLFVPGRSGEWSDLFADSIGIACGAIIASSILRFAYRRL